MSAVPEGARRWADIPDAERAIQHFASYLGRPPEELEVRWLLNLAYMTLGGYPDKVPPALSSRRPLLPRAKTSAGSSMWRRRPGSPFGSAGGVIVDDFDDDGRLDVVTSSIEQLRVRCSFFRRDPERQF